MDIKTKQWADSSSATIQYDGQGAGQVTSDKVIVGNTSILSRSITTSGNISADGIVSSKGRFLVVSGNSIPISLGDDGIIEAADVNASELVVSDSTNYVNITPSAIKVKKNGTTGIGVTQSFSIKATGTYNGQLSDYLLTLTFTNGILTGYDTNGFPGTTV